MCVFVGCRGLLVLSIAVVCCWTAEGLPMTPPESSPSDDAVGLSCISRRNGRLLPHGEREKLSDCSSCVCDNSTLSCQVETCPPLPCSRSQRIKVEGECCKICSNIVDVIPDDLPCQHEGQIVRHGERQQYTECIFCLCDNSTLSCQFETCPPLNCRHKIKLEGQCCRICKNIDVIPDDLPCQMSNGQIVLHGERGRMSDCSICVCDNSTLSCMFESCPPLTCSRSQRIKVEGECCNICPNNVIPVDLPCQMSNGQIVLHGERGRMSECSTCVCDNSTLSCVFESCPPLTCSRSQRIKVEGECCKICSNIDVIPDDLPCQMRNGQIVLHGELKRMSECSTCVCDNSTLSCMSESCPPLTCSPSQRIKVEGKCCKICPKTSTISVPEDVDGDDGRNETPPSTDISLDSLLLQVEQERLNIERDNLEETRKMNANFADLISVLETH